MSVRLRRLKADYERLSSIFTRNSRIRIKKTLGSPPEKYQVEYLVTGMEKLLGGQFRVRPSFLVEITLTSGYPRVAPQCRMLTPVFHPNIAPHAVCIGDHWAAGEALANLVVRIAEMLSFQSYNVKSPLNGEAAKWAVENQRRLPLDRFDFSSLLSVGEAVGRRQDGTSVAGNICANCGKTGEPAQMVVCADSHASCSDCALQCPVCDATACLRCPLVTCATCRSTVCARCGRRCRGCEQTVCARHAGPCAVCQDHRCRDCLVDCTVCGRAACLQHVASLQLPAAGAGYACANCAQARAQ